MQPFEHQHHHRGAIHSSYKYQESSIFHVEICCRHLFTQAKCPHQNINVQSDLLFIKY